jgi:hypothetical protein
MPSRRVDAFPFAAVRDLLGILRALWLSTPEANSMRRIQIGAVAQQLRASLELAKLSTPGTPGYTDAWRRAEAATRAAGKLVDVTATLEPVLLAATLRVVGIAGGVRRKPPVGH